MREHRFVDKPHFDPRAWGLVLLLAATTAAAAPLPCAPRFLPAKAPASAPMSYAYPVDTICGDGACNGYEDCSNCWEDCGFCNVEYCGDGVCQWPESCSDCPGDCGVCSENRSVTVWDDGGTARRYWADHSGNAIWRSLLGGSQAEVVASGVNRPFGISYDPATRQVLWTSSGDESVQAVPVGGGSVITLQSSFEDNFAIVIQGEDVHTAFSVLDGQVVKIVQNRHTGEEQREVLLELSSPDEVRGLALSTDHTALYLGDPVGRMSRKLTVSSHSVQPLVFEEGGPQTLTLAPASQPSFLSTLATLETPR